MAGNPRFAQFPRQRAGCADGELETKLLPEPFFRDLRKRSGV